MMHWYQWMALGAALLCTGICTAHACRLIRMGRPHDFSKQRGPVGPAVKYSMTGAMSPKKKESAFLHLPTYLAGLVYHAGTFGSLMVFPLLLLGLYPGNVPWQIVGLAFVITGMSGLGILIKRISQEKLRRLSNPDDYISNLLVSAMQLFTAMVIVSDVFAPAYFILATLLFLYFPVGKLKHTVYFFAARYHLGFFFGWRGIWPPNTN